MHKPFETKLVSRIYGNGKGLIFSQAYFSGLGTRAGVDMAVISDL